MNEKKSETMLELSSNSDVSSTMKKTEIEESSSFKISNMIVEDTSRFLDTSENYLTHEKIVQSSSSPISTTQNISNEGHQRKSSGTIDAEMSSPIKKCNPTYNISNADTTTVQGKQTDCLTRFLFFRTIPIFFTIELISNNLLGKIIHTICYVLNLFKSYVRKGINYTSHIMRFTILVFV